MKKKAIKIAAASVIAASSFGAVAPFTTEAAAVKAPAVQSTTVVNAKTLKITFDNGKTITKTFTKDVFKPGAVTVSFGAYNTSYKVTVTTPKVSKIDVVSNNQFKVTFDNGTTITKNISEKYALKAGENKVSFGANGISYSAVVYNGQGPTTAEAIDATHIKIVFENGATLTKTLKTPLKDGENKVSFGAYYTSYSVTVNYNVAAKVESVSAINAKQIVVKFNKPVFSADAVADQTGIDAQNPANYTLNSTAATKAELSSDKKSVTLTFASAEADNKVLIVEKIATPAKDKDGSVIKTVKYSQVFSYADTVAPTVVGTSYANGKITLEFSEAVGTLPTVVRVNGTPVDSSKIANGATANKVDVTYALTAGTTANLYVAGAKDAATTANEMPLFNGTVIATSADTGKPQIVGVQVTGQNTAKVTLSEAVNETSIAAKLQKGDTQTAVTLEKDLTDTTGKTYTLTVDLNGTGTAGDGIFSGTSTSETFTLYVAAGAMHDLATTPNVNDLFSTSLTFNKDVKAPSFVSSQVSSDNQKLEFKFDEDLSVVGSDANIVIKNADGVKIAAIDAETGLKTGDAKTYQVDTKATAVALDAGTYTVTLPAGFFTDARGNQSVTVTSTFTVGAASTTDTTKPTAVVANLSGVKNTFEVTYNEEVSSSALSLANYQLDGKSLPAGTEIYFTNTTKKIVDIVLPVNSINIGNQAAGASAILTVSGVADKAGNVVNTFNTSVSVNDNTAATITGVQVIGQDVYVTFNEDVTVPATTDADLAFDLTVNNVAVTAGNMSAVPGNTKQVKFTLDTAPAAALVVKVKAGQPTLTDANGVAVK